MYRIMSVNYKLIIFRKIMERGSINRKEANTTMEKVKSAVGRSCKRNIGKEYYYELGKY